MNNDVFAGIRNAVIRGDSIEKAARSFINAGYSEAEVREVVEALQRGTLSISPAQAAPIVQQKPVFQSIAQPAQQIQSQITPLPKNQTARDIKSLFSNPFKKKTVQPLPMSMPTQQPQAAPLLSGALPQTKIKRGFDPVLVILIAVLIVLVGILITSLFFKEQIASFLGFG